MSIKSENRKEYMAWLGMKRRCYNTEFKSYKRYGGRGISVCSEWIDSFESFFSYMGKCPAGFSIDRIDNDEGYTPGNCRWASIKTQQNNRSFSIIVEINGEKKPLSEWVADERCEVSKSSLWKKYKLGYLTSLSELKARKRDEYKPMHNSKIISVFGSTGNIRKMAMEFNVKYTSVVGRYNKYHGERSDEYILFGDK